MKYSQKIGCDVHECKHNHNQESACTLEKIQVTPCGGNGSKTPEDETACGMYSYAGEPDDEDNEDKGIKLTL